MSRIQIHHGSPVHPWPGRIWRRFCRGGDSRGPSCRVCSPGNSASIGDAASSSRRAVQVLARRLGALAAKWRSRRAVNQLARLDDRMLADIGINRGEIEFVTRYSRDGAAILCATQSDSRALAAAHFPPL